VPSVGAGLSRSGAAYHVVAVVGSRSAEYEQMILITFAVLGVFLLMASRHPSWHRSLIGFAAWSSLAHGQMEYSINGNEVAVCADPADFDAFMALFESPATAEAMEFDGIKRGTVKVYVMDHVWDL